MPPNDQAPQSPDLFELGRQMGAKLPPEHAKSLIQQILSKGQVADPTADLGTAAADPGPADQDMSQIPGSAWAPQAPRQPAQAPTGSMAPRIPAQSANLSAVQPALDNQNEDVQKLRDIAGQVENTPQKMDLSPLAAYADALNGGKTNFAASYKAPLSPDQRAVEVAKLRQMASQAANQQTAEQMKMLMGQLRNDGVATRALAQLAAKGTAADDKKTENDRKWIDADTQKAATALNLYANKRDTTSVIGGTMAQAARIATLMAQYKKDPNTMPALQINELGTSMARLLNAGTSGASEGQIAKLTPNGLPKDLSNMQSYWSGQPQGAQMGDWVNLLSGTVNREMGTAAAQLHTIRQRALTGFSELYKHPVGKENLYNAAQANGVSPAEVDDAFNYKAASRQGKYQELPYQGSGDTQPSQVSDDDWAAASDKTKADLIKKYGAPK